jgi:hypothetical protein
MPAAAVVLVLFVVFGGAAAHAKPSKKDEAKRHYDAASAHYKAAEYDQAIAEFEAGYALDPKPGILFNLGQACRLAREPEKALEYYQKYLAEDPEAPNRAAVEQRIAEVKQEIDAAKAPPPPERSEPPPPERSEPPPPPAPPISPNEPTTPYQLGVRVRYLFVTASMMAPFLVKATSLNGASVGVEFIYRKPTFDVVTSLDMSFLPVDDGNYLAVNKDPALDTQYTQFRNLSLLSVDVSLIGHHTWQSAPWLEFRYGGGLGIGAVLGDILLTHDSGCTLANAGDIAQCHPIGVDLTAADREAQLKATENGATKDTAGNPHRHVTSDKPPVMGVVNLLLGLRFKLPHKFTADVEVGFRDALFVGGGVHYLF